MSTDGTAGPCPARCESARAGAKSGTLEGKTVAAR